ncbi:phosphoethanolamine--lipid A transferase [Paenochrobactrum glaciei]|uniref:Phosphoethanolamine--lipid A transferase n=1 Tax=Paenochrobactrum glaciei TaxID=486407 RepID=A0ABP3QVI9_9HYPH
MRLARPSISSGLLCVLTALYLLFCTNKSFWTLILQYFDGQLMKVAVMAVALLLLHIAILVLFSAHYVIKPFLILMVMIAAGGSYFGETFGTIITRNVVEATLTTTAGESRNLLTTGFITHMLIYGVVPSLLIAWVRVIHRPILKKIMVNTVVIIGCVVGFLILIGSDFGAYSSMYRMHRNDIVARLVPYKPVASTVDYFVRHYTERQIVMQPLGQDAAQETVALPEGKKLLTVVVVGETARAQNFSLNGYNRETNPELKKRDVIAFTNTTSCGTETSVSVPCMFSPFPRTDYSSAKFKGSENLLDVLQYAGVKVEWWENNTGDKGVADRSKLIDLQNSNDPKYCDGGECLDQILSDYLRDHLKDFDGNTTLVLHMTGSHGPAYYMRYPPEMARFKPECRTAEFSECEDSQIVNAYDNTILYTDKILSQIIDILKANEDNFVSSMIYMSDHGESLGESGLYLHAAPYFIAPDTQTHIPFITWFSPDYQAVTGTDLSCLRASTAEESSHDNLFHTVLGMMNVKTSVYDRSLDRFAACRK